MLSGSTNTGPAPPELIALAEREFRESIAVKTAVLEALRVPLAQAGALLFRALAAGGKILVCGNGGSAADAQHLASELVNRFERDRVGLAALALTTDSSMLTSIANDQGYERIYARQIEVLGQPGDVLVAITTSGHSPNILEAARAAQRAGLRIIAFNGRDGGALAPLLGAEDVELRIAHPRTARIQEVHLTLIHCLCSLIEAQLEQHPLPPRPCTRI